MKKETTEERLKKFKKVDNKIYVTEDIESEVDKGSYIKRVETLDIAIAGVEEQIAKLTKQKENYIAEKATIEADIKEINKLK